jgi:hypothetical protein
MVEEGVVEDVERSELEQKGGVSGGEKLMDEEGPADSEGAVT